MTDDGLARARELFLSYSGSHQYMFRDGVEDEYESLDVPPALECEWLATLTEQHLQLLYEAGNWRAVGFLTHHRMWDHLDAIVAAGPLGEWWERCAFWENVLRYIEGLARVGPDRALAPLCDRVADEARTLARSQPPDQPTGRSARLEDAATVMARQFRSRNDFRTRPR